MARYVVSLGGNALGNNSEEQKKALNADIKYIYEEAEHRGFDKKALREVLKRRKMDANDARELDFSLDLYKVILGMA